MATSIDRLIERLAAAENEHALCNPYRADDDEDNGRRRHNLRLYLGRALASEARGTLLVCEAPGYRGCRLTGIPLCSRRLLRQWAAAGDGASAARYLIPADRRFAGIEGEQSATIARGELRALGMRALIWNAFPWHPHRPGEPLSNRRPKAAELVLGRDVLAQLLALMAPRRVLAIGRSAQAVLRALDVAHDFARHPAHGGKGEFVASLRRFASAAESGADVGPGA